MAHAIESMMWIGETPWHGLGKQLETPPASGQEALGAAGLDWQVELKDLRLVESATEVTHKAVIRTDRNEVLGVVGPGYRPYQNAQMAKLYDPLIQEGTVSIETAGSLQDGKRVWMLGRLKGDMDIDGRGDVVRKYLLLAHGHDGSLAVRFGFTPIRVVCANTLSAAIGDQKSALVKCLHTTNLDSNLTILRNAMVAADETFELTAEEFREVFRVWSFASIADLSTTSKRRTSTSGLHRRPPKFGRRRRQQSTESATMAERGGQPTTGPLSGFATSRAATRKRDSTTHGSLSFLDDLAAEIRQINEANGWNVLQEAEWSDRYKVPCILALIHSEVSEALEAFRHDDGENFVEEMADVLIRVLDCVGGLTDEFGAAVAAKLAKNRERGYRHGGKRV